MSIEREAAENAWRTLLAQSRGFPVVLHLRSGGATAPGRVVERDHQQSAREGTTVAVRLEPGDWTHLGDVQVVRSAR